MKLNNKKIGRKIFLPILFILIAIILCLSLIKINVLFIRDNFTKDLKKVEYIKKDSLFGIIYTHSVMLTETSEWYKAKGDKLILMEERYNSQGAGLPVNLIYKFKHEKGGDFVLYDINEHFDSFIYRTGAVRANHRLKIGNKLEYFLEFSEPREALEFSTKRISIFNYLLRRCQVGR